MCEILLQFLAIMTGLNKANSIYACVWCTVARTRGNVYTFLCNVYAHVHVHVNTALHVHGSKLAFHEHFRWDMSVAEEKYNTPPPRGSARTLASLQQNCTFSKAEKHLASTYLCFSWNHHATSLMNCISSSEWQMF